MAFFRRALLLCLQIFYPILPFVTTMRVVCHSVCSGTTARVAAKHSQ